MTRLAWQLHAIFNAHLQKEEQVYMPLLSKYVAETKQERIMRQIAVFVPTQTGRLSEDGRPAVSATRMRRKVWQVVAVSIVAGCSSGPVLISRRQVPDQPASKGGRRAGFYGR